ncbi:MAG: folylpolyglutamate synthase/dihydrofolate synthase family protein [Chloroflexota bacterium]
MNYQQALDYLYSLMDWEVVPRLAYDPSNYDLRRLDELLARLGNPHRQARSVHITGTKGKGSTAAMVASALTVSGYVTGLYTSPHLISLNERLQVNSQPITDEELVALTERLQPEITDINREATYGKLTTFEALTALAFLHFKQKEVEFQVLEVGLGGRLDATNVIPPPEVSVITPISLDHTEVLGDTTGAIAREKAGILKAGSILVLSPQPEEAGRVITDAASRLGVGIVRVGEDITWEYRGHHQLRQRLIVRGRRDTYELSLPLLGQHQWVNAASAVGALEVLAEKGVRITQESIVKGLAQVNWPGRLQVLSERPFLVVDGAHNVDSAIKLREALEQYFSFDRSLLIMGLSYDKDIPGISKVWAPFFDRVIVTRSRHPRGADPAHLAREFARLGKATGITDNLPTALALALSLAERKDLICATGSLFVVGEVLEKIKGTA